MSWFKRFLDNHVLANLSFALVLVLGLLSYLQMPRAKDPEINFNWISIITVFPGAAARDVEKRVTEPLEDALQRAVQNIRFVASTSRGGVSNITVRFNQLDERTFDKRLIDLRREVQNTYTDELPDEIETPPLVYEITTSSGFPSATLVVSGPGDDENLRTQARNVKKDIERLQGVDRTNPLGLHEPELHVAFFPERLEGMGITPADLADTVRAYFRDISAGDLETGDGQWIVRMEGTDSDPGRLAKFPVVTASGVVNLGSLAKLYRTSEEPSDLVRFDNEPAVMLAIVKQADTNVLELVDRVKAYVDERNELAQETGVRLFLVDDQTISTRRALSIMQSNAAIGLGMVLLVTWLFLGSRISGLTSIGIPFTLAGTFIVLHASDMTLNNSVLLGVVIALGMIVDDAVVVVESMYQRLQTGNDGLSAAIDSLREVFAPVTTSVMTTIAAFLPLMLLPGIMGEFMRVVPIVVSLALFVSLFEAYWMLPSHVISAKVDFTNPSPTQRLRNDFTRWVRHRYTTLLLKSLRRPRLSACIAVSVFLLAVAALLVEDGEGNGLIQKNYFVGDPFRLFYVSVELPAGSTLEETIAVLAEAEKRTRNEVKSTELRATLIFAGQLFTETEPLFGDNIGQVMVSLKPEAPGTRGVFEIADAVEAAVKDTPGASNVTLLRLKDGPPTARPISIKVRGDEFVDIKAAADSLIELLESMPAVIDISLDYRSGDPELVLRHDGDAIKRAGIDPLAVNRSLMAMVDGEIATTFQDQGEEVRVRVLSGEGTRGHISDLLRQTLSLPDGGSIALEELVDVEHGVGQQNIRHYNFRRSITLDADIDKQQTDTITANRAIEQGWQEMRGRHPNVALEFSGELDDLYESLDAMGLLFLMGMGLIYAILGTQFRSYFQPLMILATVPLAFTGVVLGLLITRNPLSLYTMFGVVALAGIAVNSAIVLISAANARLEAGMTLLHATVYAARRRVIPILITSLTTIAGLFSLASGLAGRSLMWGPVATAIVWGLAFSSVLTLFVVPLLYLTFMGRSARVRMAPQHARRRAMIS